MRPLTRQRARVLRAIEELVAAQGYPPSIREIGRHLALSPGTVHYHVRSLAASGHIEQDGRGHGIRVLKAPPGLPRLPLRGCLVPGLPLELEEPRESVEVTPALAEAGSYVLRLQGDGDGDAGMLEGDHLVIGVIGHGEPQDGAVAVVLLPDGACSIRRVFRSGDGFVLEAPRPGGRVVAAREVRVVGRVLGLVREY